MKIMSIAAKPGQNRLNRRFFLAKRRKNRREIPKTAWRGTDFGGNFAQKDFTVKELDPETGFYYYGARYLDPRTSRWLSGDPALGEYLPAAPVSDEAKKGNGNLPGQGGVFNLVNLHVYHYAGNNPIKYVDPDGNALNQPVILKQIETVARIAKFYIENKDALQKIGIGAAKAAMGIGIAGLGVGGGGAITIGTGGTATLGGVAVAGAAISAGGVYVGAGVADILDGIVMMAQGNGSGPNSIEDNRKYDTPETKKEAFDKVKGSTAYKNKADGTVWEKDKLHKNHWEVYKDKKNWENGRRSFDVWEDGRFKSDLSK